MADFATAEDVLNDAAVDLAIESSDLADPFASTDQNVILLCRLLKRVGRRLVRARSWSQLTREYTFPTVNGTADYALPTGFNRVKDATHWNRSTAMPLGGPANGPVWQMMKATTTAGVVVRPFRVFGNRMHLYPTPSAAENIYYEYVTNYWVMPSGQTVPTTSEPTATTDTLWFDEQLLVAGLKLAFLQAKGFPTEAAQVEFNEAYASAAGGDAPAPILTMGSIGSFRLINNENLPDTGFGS